MIDYLKSPAIIFMLFVLVVNVIFFVKNISKLNYLITLILSFIIPAALLVLKALEINLPEVLTLKIEWLCDIACALIIIENACVLKFKNNKDNDLFKAIPSALNRKIIGYLDNEGKLINFTQYFFEELNLFDKDQKKWYEHINQIFYNSEEVTYEDLLESLQENDGTEAKISVLLKNDDGFDEEVSFNFAKINVDVNDETIGYVLVAAQEQEKNLTDGFGYLLDSVDAPFAYYNDDSRNVIFRTNKAFKSLLGVRGYNVTYTELRHLVYPEDLQIFDKATSEFASDDSYIYRMKTSLGLKKFKEVKVTKENHVISIIQMVNEINDKLLDKKIVLEKIDKLISDNQPFGGIMVSLNNFVDLFNERGPIIAKELASHYISYIQSEVLGKDDSVFKISDIEYVLVITDIDHLNALVRDIQNKVSTISHYEFSYGNEVIATTNSIGIVYKNENITNSTDFINALDNALALANKDGNNDGVSLFTQEKKKEETESKITKDNYSFDKVKISLDNSFLDDDEI